MTERQKARKKRQTKREFNKKLRILSIDFAGGFAIGLGLIGLLSLTTEAPTPDVDSDAISITLEQSQLKKPSDLQNTITVKQLQPAQNGLQGDLVRR